MSADNELSIILKFVDQASQGSARWHGGERQRVKQTADATSAANKAVSKAVADSYKDMERAAKSAAKVQQQAARDAATAQRQAARDVARDAKQAARDAAQSARQSARERQSLGREVNATLREMARQEVREKTQAEREKAAAAKKALRDEIYDIKTAHQVKMMQWKWEQEASKENSEKQSSDIGGIAKAYMGLKVVTEIAGVVRQAMQVVAESTRDAREHTKGLADDLDRQRDDLREIAALRGVKGGPTAAFTAGFARQAGQAGASVGQLKEFESEFKAQAGAYVGPSEEEFAKLAPGQKKQYKMTAEQQEMLQAELLSFALSRGVKPEDAARLAGTVISKTKVGPDGKVNNEEVLSTFAKLLKVTEMAPGRTSPLLPQLAEVIQESVGEGGEFKSMEDASTLFRVMTRRNPAEGSTYARNLLRGLREITMKGQDEELGIKKDMDVFQRVEQIQKKAEEYQKSGQGTENEFLAKYFKDAREFGAARTMINAGIREGEIERAKAEAASVDAGTVRKGAQEYRASDTGQRVGQKSRVEAAKLEAAGKYDNIRQMQLEAAESLATGGELEKPEDAINAVLTKEGATFGQGGRDEQEINRVANERLRQGLSGYTEGRKWLAGHKLNLDTPPTVMAEGANLLSRLRKQARERAGKGLSAEVPTAESFQSKARQIIIDNAERSGRKLSPEQADEEANTLMAQTGKMSNPEFALPQRRKVAGQYVPFAAPGAPPRSAPDRMQTAGEYGKDVGERLAAQPNADGIMKNLFEAAKNLKDAMKPRVPPAHPGAPPVQKR